MNYRDQRKFPRVHVLKTLGGQVAELYAQVAWPNHETSAVADLSYKGMAVRRPGVFPVDVQQSVVVEVELGGAVPFRTEAKIVWGNLDWVGLQFESLPPEGHLAMRDFLDAKILGSQLRPVERVFVEAHQDFRFWFQGPENTHVYIWMEPGHAVDRVLVDLSGEIVEFARGRKPARLNPSATRALLVLSQMDKSDLPMEDFVRGVLLGA